MRNKKEIIEAVLKKIDFPNVADMKKLSGLDTEAKFNNGAQIKRSEIIK